MRGVALDTSSLLLQRLRLDILRKWPLLIASDFLNFSRP